MTRRSPFPILVSVMLLLTLFVHTDRATAVLISTAAPVSVAKNGDGTGRVIGPGITCGVGCSANYDVGSIVTLSAVPDSGSYFAGWSGDACSGNVSLTCTFTIDAGKSISANFTTTPPTVQSWVSTYGGSVSEEAHAISQTADGGYIVAGYTTSYGNNEDSWVIKLNADGSIAWQRSYDLGSFEQITDIQQTADGGFVATGFTDPAYGYAQKGFVLKLRADGTPSWSKIYDNGQNDPFSAIRETSDGGFIVAGWTPSPYGYGLADGLVVKLSADGFIQWQYVYDTGGTDVIQSIQETRDGGYIAAGYTAPNGGNGDGWLLRLDAIGGIVWQSTYGGAGNDSFKSVQQTTDGGFIVGGHSSESGNQNWLIVRLADTGTVVWQKSYGGRDYEIFNSVRQTSDGGFIAAGRTASSGVGFYDAWLIKLNSDGTISWQKTFGDTGYDELFAVQQTSDGGFVAAGTTNADFWVMKLDESGSAPSCVFGARTSTTTPTDTSFKPVDGTAVAASANLASVSSTAIVTISKAEGALSCLAPTYSVNFAVSPAGSGTLTGTASQSGITSGGSASAVTANPNPGYSFVNWTGVGFTTSSANPLTVSNVTANLNIKANFADLTPPVDGTLTPVAGNKQIVLSWSAATDVVGVIGYKLVTSTSGTPTNCNGPALYSGMALTYTDTGLTNGAPSYYRLCATDAAGNWSGGATASASPVVMYSITAAANSGGSITPGGVTALPTGGSQTYNFYPDPGYHIDTVLVDGTSQGAISSYTFSNVIGNHTISVNFAIDPHITASAGSGGSVSPYGQTMIHYGGSQMYTITPSTDFHVAGVLVDGVFAGAVTSYTFTNVTVNRTISATFAANPRITASADSTSHISPSGMTAISPGGSQTYTFSADLGYHIDHVAVDGSSHGAISSYTFNGVTSDHTIEVFSAMDPHIDAGSSIGGIVTPIQRTYLRYGGSQVYTITPDPGFHVAGVLVDGVSAGAVTSYTFDTVTANHTISASFSPNPRITANAYLQSHISPGGITVISPGSNQTYTFSADPGYHIDRVVVDGASHGAITSYTFYSVTGDHTIEVFSAMDPYIDAGSSIGGSVTPGQRTYLRYGGSLVYTITPGTGFQLINVLVDGVSVGAITSYTFNTVTANHSITATFAPLPLLTITLPALVGGSITGPTTVVTGATASYSITPPAGYTIASVSGCGGSLVGTTYTTGAVTANCSISVSLAAKLFSISDALRTLQLASGGATVTPADLQLLDVAPVVGGIPAPNGTIDLGDVVVMLEQIVGSVTW